jgi:hypothetical protein
MRRSAPRFGETHEVATVRRERGDGGKGRLDLRYPCWGTISEILVGRELCDSHGDARPPWAETGPISPSPALNW